MKVVIEIPEEIRLALINNIQLSMDQQSICDSYIKQAIVNSTPLPKGHGRLFDERDIVNGSYKIIGNRIYELEPIIEADKESEEV